MRIIKSKLSLCSWIWLLIVAVNLYCCKQQTTNVKDNRKLIDLSLNENPFGLAAGVIDSILKQLPDISRYAGKDGEEFINQIATHEDVSVEQIIPGEILNLLGICLSLKGGKGSEFIYSVPGYPALVNAAASVGGTIIQIPLNDKLENDLEAIDKQVNDKTQAVFLVNPHNPSGTLSDKIIFHDFVKSISKRTLVIVDEAYLEFADDFAGRTAVNNIKEGDNVIVFRTMAKAYGLAGLPIGYAIAPKNLAQYLKSQGLGDTFALNRLSIVAAEAALANKGNIIRVNKLVTQEREKWNVFLDKLAIHHTSSKANFIFFDTKKPYIIVRNKLEDAGILIGREFEPYNTWVRISIGLPEENVKVREAILEIVK